MAIDWEPPAPAPRLWTNGTETVAADSAAQAARRVADMHGGDIDDEPPDQWREIKPGRPVHVLWNPQEVPEAPKGLPAGAAVTIKDAQLGEAVTEDGRRVVVLLGGQLSVCATARAWAAWGEEQPEPVICSTEV